MVKLGTSVQLSLTKRDRMYVKQKQPLDSRSLWHLDSRLYSQDLWSTALFFRVGLFDHQSGRTRDSDHRATTSVQLLT